MDDALEEDDDAADVVVSDVEAVDLDAVEVDDASVAVVLVAVASVAVLVAAAVSVTLVAPSGAVSFGGVSSLGGVGALGGAAGALGGAGSPFEKGFSFPMILPNPFSASSAPSSTTEVGILMGALPRIALSFQTERLERGIFAGGAFAGGVLVPEVDGAAVAGALQSSVFRFGFAWAKKANHAKLCALVIFCASVRTSRQLETI